MGRLFSATDQHLDDGRFQIFAVDDICIVAKIVVEGNSGYESMIERNKTSDSFMDMLCCCSAIVTNLKSANTFLRSPNIPFLPSCENKVHYFFCLIKIWEESFEVLKHIWNTCPVGNISLDWAQGCPQAQST